MRVERLEPRDCPGVLASAGGWVYDLNPADGSVLRQLRPFEEQAAGVPLFVAQDAARIYVGAGAGGGPRVDAFDRGDLSRVWSVFVGDPASRTGVGVAAPVYGPLAATPHPAAPAPAAAVAAVQSRLDTIPAPVLAWLSARGVAVRVYVGPGVTVLPEFAALAGVPTSAAGDNPGRTYDTVEAVATKTGTVIGASRPDATVHEIGHVVDFNLPVADRARWGVVYESTDPAAWPTAYERGDRLESFAESFVRWVWRVPQPTPAVAAYFDSLVW